MRKRQCPACSPLCLSTPLHVLHRTTIQELFVGIIKDWGLQKPVHFPKTIVSWYLTPDTLQALITSLLQLQLPPSFPTPGCLSLKSPGWFLILHPSDPVSSPVDSTSLRSHSYLPNPNCHPLAWLLQPPFASPSAFIPSQSFPPGPQSHRLLKCEFNCDPHLFVIQHVCNIASASGLP